MLRVASQDDLDGITDLHTASQLHAAFVQFLREASLTTGILEAWERNTRAQTFYARHGWTPDGHQRPGPADANYVRVRLDLDLSV